MFRYALATLSGALYFLGFAGFDIWPLAFVALVPMLWALDPAHERTKVSGKQLLGVGMWFGLVTNFGGYYWLIGMLETFSGFPYALCVLIAILLCAYQGAQLWLFAWLYRYARTAGVGNLLAATAGMCLSEAAFPLLFEHYYGASLHSVPLALQVADLGGPLLVSGLLTAANVGIYLLLRTLQDRERLAMNRRELSIAAALWAATLGYGAYRIHEVDARVASAGKLRMGLIQTNMGTFQKQDDPDEGLRRHIEQSAALEREKKLDLLVWPESAFNWLLPAGVENVKSVVLGDAISTPTLFGGLARRNKDGRPQYFNTAFLADARGQLTGSYDKIVLLAFGEYLPFGEDFPVLYDWSPNSGRFSKGEHFKPLQLGPYRLSVMICYEDILPRFVRNMVREAEPHVLINLTNDAWFGDTHAPWEHLALAKLRSVEHHRALVRATNSGVSAVIDPVGRVLASGKVYTRENVYAEVPMLEGSTAYRMLGDFPGILSGLLMAWLWWRAKQQAKSREREPAQARPAARSTN